MCLPLLPPHPPPRPLPHLHPHSHPPSPPPLSPPSSTSIPPSTHIHPSLPPPPTPILYSTPPSFLTGPGKLAPLLPFSPCIRKKDIHKVREGEEEGHTVSPLLTFRICPSLIGRLPEDTRTSTDCCKDPHWSLLNVVHCRAPAGTSDPVSGIWTSWDTVT